MKIITRENAEDRKLELEEKFRELGLIFGSYPEKQFIFDRKWNWYYRAYFLKKTLLSSLINKLILISLSKEIEEYNELRKALA